MAGMGVYEKIQEAVVVQVVPLLKGEAREVQALALQPGHLELPHPHGEDPVLEGATCGVGAAIAVALLLVAGGDGPQGLLVLGEVKGAL